MCGRFFTDIGLSEWVSHSVGFDYQVEVSPDVRPTHSLACIISDAGILQQRSLQWGIKPAWANKLIINAQAETVATKPTFRGGFRFARCLIPCSGWYEWHEKQKYSFNSPEPVLMAGIGLEGGRSVVILTTEATGSCRDYHHRMPLIIPKHSMISWLQADPETAAHLLSNYEDHHLQVALSG